MPATRWLAAVLLFAATADGAQFVRQRTLVSPDAATQDEFGKALTVVGGSLLIGEPGWAPGTQFGFAWLFDPTAGTVLRVLAAEPPVIGNRFGSAVADVGGKAFVTDQ